jgi:hypothetical protein
MAGQNLYIAVARSTRSASISCRQLGDSSERATIRSRSVQRRVTGQR